MDGKVKIKSKDTVYKVVKEIPRGKVMSYGQISRIVNDELRTMGKNQKINPRNVGYFLHRNPKPIEIPCHRVVDRNGKLAENYAFGGWRQQKRELIKEGVLFKDINHVDKKSFLT